MPDASTSLAPSAPSPAAELATSVARQVLTAVAASIITALVVEWIRGGNETTHVVVVDDKGNVIEEGHVSP